MPKSPNFLEELLFSKYIVNQLSNAVFCLALDARFLYLNNAACDRFEYFLQELLSMRLSDIDINFSPKTLLERWQFLRQQNFLVVKSNPD